MTKKDAMRIPDYLEHILKAIKRIFDYVEDIGLEEQIQNIYKKIVTQPS